jgi:AcrR family transcriptional regulator
MNSVPERTLIAMPPRPTPPRRSRTARKGPAARRALRDQAREVYRDAILEAAEEVLAERGFHGTRMQDVARRAGLASGTLYNYFPSKERLTVSLLELRVKQFEARVRDGLAALGPRASVIELVVHASLAHLDEHRALFRMFQEDASGLGADDDGQRCQGDYRQVVLDALAVARTRGELRADLSIDDATMLLGGMIQGVARAVILFGMPGAARDRAALVLDVFRNGVRPS